MSVVTALALVLALTATSLTRSSGSDVDPSVVIASVASHDKVERAVSASLGSVSEATPGQRRAALATVRGMIDAGDVEVHLGHATLAVDEAGVAVDDAGRIAVSFPVVGSRIVEPSNLTVYLSQRMTLVNYVETRYTSSDLRIDAGRLTQWVDGEQRIDQMVDAAGNTWAPADAAPSATEAGAVELVWSWSKFKSCLNAQGVSAWVVTAISIACSAICIASFGSACAACIAAAGAITSGVIAHCVRVAS